MQRASGERKFLLPHVFTLNASAAGITGKMLAAMPITRQYAVDAYQIYMVPGKYGAMRKHAALVMAHPIQ